MIIICTYLSCFDESNQIKLLCIYVPVLMTNTIIILLEFHLNVYVARSKESGADRLFCTRAFYCCGISIFSHFEFVASKRSEYTRWLSWHIFILPLFTFSSREASWKVCKRKMCSLLLPISISNKDTRSWFDLQIEDHRFSIRTMVGMLGYWWWAC